MNAISMNPSAQAQPSLIYRKMIDLMCEIGPVSKDQKNIAQGFKFRGIDQFINALHPALAKHKVFMAPRCVSDSHEMREVVRSNGKTGIDKHTHLTMEYAFYAEDGSSVVIGPIPAEGLDSGDKSTTKALSAALKYALIQTFSIPTEDMSESDSDSPEIQPGHAPQPQGFIQPQPLPRPQAVASGQFTHDRKPSEAQLKRLFAISKTANVLHEDVKAFIYSQWNRESSKDLSLAEYDQLCQMIQAGELGSNTAAVPPAIAAIQPDESASHWFKNDPRNVK